MSYPYVCDKCGHFQYENIPYCERCGSKNTLRNITKKDWKKHNLIEEIEESSV
ncbi:MAG: zinc ribbon domain-containing protein [Promethearchaeota archaeon]